MDLSGEGDAWRVELIGLGVPAGLITAAQAEVRVIHVRAELHSELLPAPDDAVSGVIEHVKILGEPAQWETATTYESLALALMDAIWSIGVRYAGVVNVINRYRGARRRDGADPDADTPQELVAFIQITGGYEAFAEAVDNRQRTSSRSGILKAEAVLLAARALVSVDVETPQDLAHATPERLAEMRRRWTAITGQGSGLSWDYFLMLSGLQGVKADRMVRRFVADRARCRRAGNLSAGRSRTCDRSCEASRR